MMNNKGKQQTPKRTARKRSSRSQGKAPQARGSIAAGYSHMQQQSVTWGGKPTKAMELRMAAYDVVAGPATTYALRGSSGVGSESTGIQLGLTNQAGLSPATSGANNFISPALDLEASSFTRFRAKKLKFKYCPQSGTATTNQLVFAYAADPNHPLIFTATPSQTKLESVADSIPFAPWEEWEMDVSREISKDWLYTYEGGSDSRLSSLGSIGCQASVAGTAGTGDKFGVLYVHLEVEFKEFCPISVTRPSLDLLRKKLTQIESPEGEIEARLVEQAVKSRDWVLSSSKPLPKLTHTEFVPRFQELRKRYSAQESITLMAAEYRFSKSLRETLLNAFPGLKLPQTLISKDVESPEKEFVQMDVSSCVSQNQHVPDRIITKGTTDEFWSRAAKAGEGK